MTSDRGLTDRAEGKKEKRRKTGARGTKELKKARRSWKKSDERAIGSKMDCQKKATAMERDKSQATTKKQRKAASARKQAERREESDGET